MKNWESQEWKVAKELGGDLTPGSGNKGIKGDVTRRDCKLVVEVKSTEKDSLRIQENWFIKLIKRYYPKRTSNLAFCFAIQDVRTYYVLDKIESIKETKGPWKTANLSIFSNLNYPGIQIEIPANHFFGASRTDHLLFTFIKISLPDFLERLNNG